MPQDERTPDVIDGARFLGLSQKDGMRELGVTSEQAYARAYKDVEAAVYARDNRASQGGVQARGEDGEPGRHGVSVGRDGASASSLRRSAPSSAPGPPAAAGRRG